MAEFFKNYVAGEFHSPPGAERFFSVNPARTSDVLGEFAITPAEEVSRAVEAARQAFPAWKAVSRPLRAEVIDRFVQLCKKNQEELAKLVTRECGKPEGMADVIEGIHMSQVAAAFGRLPYGEVIGSEIASKDAFLLRRPVGVIAAISPWNFPFAIPLWLFQIAMVEGNTIVFKPSEDTPLCGQRIAGMLHEAGVPPGVFNLVHGDGATGKALVEHEDINAVCFTGSYEVGRLIRMHCAAHPHKRAATECGGKSGLIITKHANLELAVNAAVLGCFRTAGQRCVSTSRLIVDESILPKFVPAFIERTKQIRIGDALRDPNVFCGPQINREAVEKVERYNQMVRDSGRKVLLNGGPSAAPEHREGHFMSPFVYQMDQYDSSFRPLQEEIFGMNAGIIPYPEGDFEEALRIHNDTEYGLAGAVITGDMREAREFKERAEVGLMYINLPTIGAEVHLPFGGLKRSGNGHPSAITLREFVTDKVALTHNFSSSIQLAQGLSAKVQ